MSLQGLLSTILISNIFDDFDSFVCIFRKGKKETPRGFWDLQTCQTLLSPWEGEGEKSSSELLSLMEKIRRSQGEAL